KHSLNLRDTITFSLASLFLYSYSANQPSNKLRHLILIPNKTIYKYFVYYELEHTYSLLIGQDRKGFGNNGSTIVFSISDNHPAFLRYYLSNGLQKKKNYLYDWDDDCNDIGNERWFNHWFNLWGFIF